MKMETTIAISPSGREMGVAVLRGEDLIYYGCKSLQKRGTNQNAAQEAARIMRGLRDRFRPDAIVLGPAQHSAQTSKQLPSVLTALVKTIKAANIQFRTCTQTQIVRYLGGEGKVSLRETARLIGVKYPVLSPWDKLKSKWEQLHYGRMFRAIVAGLADFDCRRCDSSRHTPCHEKLDRELLGRGT